jgi:hypothetical protein
MNKFLLSTVFLAAFGANPSWATLQIAADISGSSFTCADGAACDTSPTPDVIITNNATLDGILFSSSSASSDSGPVDFLNAANLLITNTNSVPVDVTITVSNTGFTAPTESFNDASSGVWQGSAVGTATFKWFIDPTNTQGANNAFDTPGALVDTAFSSSVGPVLAFSRNEAFINDLTSPYSMTEQVTLHLGAGESIVNRGQTIIGTSAVPEPSTWAMLMIGGLGLAFAARSQRKGLRTAF